MTKLALIDTLVVAMAVVGAQLLRFGSGGPVLTGLADFRVSYSWLSPALVVAWLIALRLNSAYDSRLVGHGPEEFKIVAGASFWLFAAVAVVCYVGQLPVARGYVALAMPAGLVGLLVHRWLWRRWLTGQRTKGRMSGSVLVVGDHDHLSSLIASFQSVPGAGFRVVAACCSDAPEGSIESIPVVGEEGDAAAAAARLGVNTVACTSSWRLGASGLRRLGWALEGLNIDLVVSPGLTDVAGPRVLTRPVAGLPVLHVEAPVFAGPRLALKTLLDRVGAAALLVLFGPLFVVIAVSVWAHDRGPILFSHDRIGRGGKTFRMHKFRSMVTNAEDLLPDLLATSGIGSVPLYKVRRDPRVTPVGSWLRRFSLDELPQLINVVRGEMSLVGPAPAGPVRGGHLRQRRPPPAPGQARYDGSVADQRPQQPVLGPSGAVRPLLRGELVGDARPDDPVAHRTCCRRLARRLLSGGATTAPSGRSADERARSAAGTARTGTTAGGRCQVTA